MFDDQDIDFAPPGAPDVQALQSRIAALEAQVQTLAAQVRSLLPYGHPQAAPQPGPVFTMPGIGPVQPSPWWLRPEIICAQSPTQFAQNVTTQEGAAAVDAPWPR